MDPTPEPNPISWAKLLEVPQDVSKKVIVDCRPAGQHSIVRFVSPETIKNVPVQELTSLQAEQIQQRLSVSDQETPIYLFCKTGVSSRQGVRHLLNLGFKSTLQTDQMCSTYQEEFTDTS